MARAAGAAVGHNKRRERGGDSNLWHRGILSFGACAKGGFASPEWRAPALRVKAAERQVAAIEGPRSVRRREA